MLDQNRVLGSLSPGLLERLKPRLRMHEFTPPHVLFGAGDKVASVYFMASGGVSLVTELSTGQMIESALIGVDGIVGGGAALDDKDAMYKAVVQMGGRCYSLDVDTARHIARESEEFRTAIVRHEQLILAQAQQTAACNATHNLQERLARWLLRARDVTGSDHLVLTQEAIAEMLGVGRTSVSIVAHTLQQGGLISYRRGHIKIEKLDALRETSCECYSTIKHRYDSTLHPEITAKAPAMAR